MRITLLFSLLTFTVGVSTHAASPADSDQECMKLLLDSPWSTVATSDFFSVPRIVFVIGSTGSGKTYLIQKALLPFQQAKGFSTEFIPSVPQRGGPLEVRDLINPFSPGFMSSQRGHQGVSLDPLEESDILVLDDVKFLELARLDQLLLTRFRARKSTIVVLRAEAYQSIERDLENHFFPLEGIGYISRDTSTHKPILLINLGSNRHAGSIRPSPRGNQ